MTDRDPASWATGLQTFPPGAIWTRAADPCGQTGSGVSPFGVAFCCLAPPLDAVPDSDTGNACPRWLDFRLAITGATGIPADRHAVE
jgi:hypothetical protein